MEIWRCTAHGISELLQKKAISAVEVATTYIEREDTCQAFLMRSKELALHQAEVIDKRRLAGDELHPLAGVPIAIKDNICTQGITTTCASKALEGFIPPYDATAVFHLKNAGQVILGKTNLDEFAMGSTGENSAYQKTDNPVAPGHVPGGSSSGSAAAVAGYLSPIALGSDTGGSVRLPAAYCGIVGLKPSYGAISRFGLISFASSLEQIGILAHNVDDITMQAKILYNRDCMDQTSIEVQKSNILKKLRIGIINTSPMVEYAVNALCNAGGERFDVKFNMQDYLLSIYYIISSAEAASNLARYDGIEYGFADRLGCEARRRIALGNYVLSANQIQNYYEKACKARRLVTSKFEECYENIDILISPTSTTCAPKLNELSQNPCRMYEGDHYTVLANLTGSPAISVPVGTNAEGLPVGVMLHAKRGYDWLLLHAAKILEEQIGGGKHDL